MIKYYIVIEIYGMNVQKCFSGPSEIANKQNKPIVLNEEYPNIMGTFLLKNQSIAVLPNQPWKERTRRPLGKKLLLLSIPW